MATIEEAIAAGLPPDLMRQLVEAGQVRSVSTGKGQPMYEDPNTGMPLGARSSSIAPQGFTIDDPNLRASYNNQNAQLQASAIMSESMDRAMRQRDADRLQILNAAKGLDPQLQAIVMQRLGFQTPPGGIMSAQDRQLGASKELESFKYNMRGGEREGKQQLQEGKLSAIQERYQQLANQFQQQQMLAMQKQQLQEQAEQRRGGVAMNQAAPFVAALKEIQAAAEGGASPEQLQALIEGLGYEKTGQKRTGGFLGMGGTDVPTIGMRRPQISGQSQQQGSSKAPPNALRTRSKSGKPMFSVDGGKTWEYEQ